MLRFMKNIVMIPNISRSTKDAFLIPYSAIQKVAKSNNILYIGPFNGKGALTLTYDTEELAMKDFNRLMLAMNGSNTPAESPLAESERPRNMSGPTPDAWAVAQLR